MNLKSLMSTSLRQRQDRRAVLRAMAGAFSTAVVPAITVAKPAAKVDICHYDAEIDAFRLISVNGNALGAHLDHGDYEPYWQGTCEICVTFAGFVDAQVNVARYSDTGLLLSPRASPVQVGPFMAGDVLTITASGSATNGINDDNVVWTGPEGRTDPLRLFGSLFGVMNGTPFHIGAFSEFTVVSDGLLDLYYFDTNTADNRGGYDVTVVACR